MAAKGYPSWLLDSKLHVTTTKEWRSFVESLTEALQQQLANSHIQSFNDLNEEGKAVFLDKAAKSIQGGDAFGKMYGVICNAVDQHLNNRVAKHLIEDFPISTKSDLILEEAEEGIISLLRRWPDMKSKLQIHFNQPLSPKLRQFYWKLALENPKVKELYLECLKKQPKKAVSPLDLEISQTCEKLLTHEETLKSLNGSISAFYGMKAVLSYHHALQKTLDSLPQQDVLLMVPFVAVAQPYMSRTTPAPDKVVTLLVEEYLNFMYSRPEFMVQGENGEESTNQATKRIVRILKEKCPEFVHKLTDVFLSTQDKPVETDYTREVLLVEAVQALSRPLLTNLFVTYLPLDAVLYIWDQYMLGLNSRSFHEIYVPAVAGIHIMLLSDKLIAAETMETMDQILREEGRKLTTRQFQFEIEKHFYEELFERLTEGHRRTVPSVDPAKVQHPFINWHNEDIPGYTQPYHRHQARHQRDVERSRIAEAARLEEQAERETQEKANRVEFERYVEQTAANQRRIEEDRLRLQEQLQQEKAHRLEEEEKATREMERLQKEIEDLKTQRPTTGQQSEPPPEGEPAADAAEETDNTETLRRVVIAFQKVGEDDGEENEDLDQETRRLLEEHRKDLKQAELELFGKRMRAEEYTAMSASERETNTERLLELLKKRLQEREAQDATEAS